MFHQCFEFFREILVTFHQNCSEIFVGTWTKKSICFNLNFFDKYIFTIHTSSPEISAYHLWTPPGANISPTEPDRGTFAQISPHFPRRTCWKNYRRIPDTWTSWEFWTVVDNKKRPVNECNFRAKHIWRSYRLRRRNLYDPRKNGLESSYSIHVTLKKY